MIETPTNPEEITGNPLWEYFCEWFQNVHKKDVTAIPKYEWRPFWECFITGAFVGAMKVVESERAAR